MAKKKKKQTRRVFDEAFKTKVAKRFLAGGSASVLGEELGVYPGSIRQWAGLLKGTGRPTTKPSKEEASIPEKRPRRAKPKANALATLLGNGGIDYKAENHRLRRALLAMIEELEDEAVPKKAVLALLGEEE